MTNSLRIALVLNPFTLRRKGGDHAPSIARELLGRGHAVRVFGDVIGGIPQSRIEGGGGDDDAAPLDGASLGAFRPDVIVAYDGLSPAAWRGARAARLFDTPLVLIEEGFPDTGKTVERVLRGFGARAWGNKVRRSASRVIALDPVAEAQAQREGFDPEIVVTLPSGVDCQMFRPGLSSEVLHRHRITGHVLLHIGRIEAGRGIDVLVEAFARTAGQQGDWTLVFAGNGTARDQVRAQAERMGIGARVRWAPVPRTAELPGIISSATALLVPALDDDVASLKIRRAMSCGVPVLVSDVHRLIGTVENEVTGLVVARGDVDAWSSAIARLASDPNRRARWGRAAREAALQRLSWSHVTESFEQILLEAIERHRSQANGDITDDGRSEADGDGADRDGADRDGAADAGRSEPTSPMTGGALAGSGEDETSAA